MRFCQPHWDALRAAIDKRGLMALVAKDGAAALQNTVLELEGREKEAYYDPLMSAHWMIAGAAQQRIGLALLVGDLCPVCEGIKWNLAHQAEHGIDAGVGRLMTQEDEERYWIDGPADAVLAEARARKLVA
jgi:hypothetical protein